MVRMRRFRGKSASIDEARAVAAASLGAAALLWWFPARWAMPWLRGALHGLDVRQVSGTLWDGRAGQLLTRDGRALGAVRWQLSRGARCAGTPMAQPNGRG
jgi:hypothetical protein